VKSFKKVIFGLFTILYIKVKLTQNDFNMKHPQKYIKFLFQQIDSSKQKQNKRKGRKKLLLSPSISALCSIF
jgi:hypothetical protein